MKCCWEGREDKRVKERQKKGQKWFLKRKYEEKKNTESSENNSILIQLSDFYGFFTFHVQSAAQTAHMCEQLQKGARETDRN